MSDEPAADRAALEAEVADLRQRLARYEGEECERPASGRSPAEQEAEHYRRLFSQAETIAGLGAWEWEMATNRILWSDNYYRLVGIAPGTPITIELFRSLVHPDDLDTVQRLLQTARTTGRSSRSCYRLIINDQVRHIESLSRYECDADGTPVRGFGVIVDVTERVRAEEARHAAEQELAKQRALQIRSDRLRSLGELSASIAHELNQPLVGVRGLTEHLLLSIERGWDISPETLRHRLGGILEQADRMEHIVQHVRRYTSGANRLDMQAIDVNESVEHAVSLLKAQLEARDIVLTCDLGTGLPTVLANAYSLEEVLLNLLVNARDAVEDAKAADPAMRGCIWVSTRGELNVDTYDVWIDVRDNGVGINEAIRDRVMEPFFTTKGPDRGTGLGLPISQAIVRGFGGCLELPSHYGDGTTVSVMLPGMESGGPAEAWLLRPE